MTEYLGRLRVEKARKKLVDPYRKVAGIAYEVGLSSLSQFNRNFRKYAGESPSEYRERQKTLEHFNLSDFQDDERGIPVIS
jgi:two-component system response regulator YesN